MPRPKTNPDSPNIVSVQLTPQGKSDFDAICDARGMTIKTVLGRIIDWFCELDRTEQAIVLGQVEVDDVKSLSDMIKKRRGG